MRQMQFLAFFQVIVWCLGLAAILVMLAGMVSAMAQTQSLDGGNPANEVIVKSGHFMVRDHLVIDLQNGVEWMRCSVGQIWNGTGCEGVALDGPSTVPEPAQASGVRDSDRHPHRSVFPLVFQHQRLGRRCRTGRTDL